MKQFFVRAVNNVKILSDQPARLSGNSVCQTALSVFKWAHQSSLQGCTDTSRLTFYGIDLTVSLVCLPFLCFFCTYFHVCPFFIPLNVHYNILIGSLVSYKNHEWESSGFYCVIGASLQHASKTGDNEINRAEKETVVKILRTYSKSNQLLLPKFWNTLTENYPSID